MRIFTPLFAAIGLIFCAQNASAQGYAIFDDSYLHTIEITFYETNFWDTLEANYDALYDQNGDLIIGIDKKYMVASVVFDGTSIDSVGVRLKGFFSNWGANSQKKPFKLDLNEFVQGQKYDGLKKFNLGNAFNDPTMLRDKLSLDMMRDAGMIAARCSHTKLYINGEYWGLYNIIEQYDDDFLDFHFDMDTGNLYKNMNNSNMDWYGSNPVSYQEEFEKKTNEIEDDWYDLVHLIDVSNNTPAGQYKDSIDANMYMHGFLTCMAVDRFLNNWDSYFDHGRNYYMYNDPEKGKFHWLPWDYNLSFSSTGFDAVPAIGGWQSDPKPIVDNAMLDTDLKNQYLSIVCTILHNVVDVNEFNDRVDTLANMIRQAVYDDTKKETSNNQFDQNLNSNAFVGWDFLPGLTSLVNNKKNAWIQELSNLGFSCAVALEEEQAELSIKMYPNPSNGQVNLDLAGSYTGDLSMTIIDVNGRVVKRSDLSRGNNIIDMQDASKGVYFVQLNGSKINRVEKLVIY